MYSSTAFCGPSTLPQLQEHGHCKFLRSFPSPSFSFCLIDFSNGVPSLPPARLLCPANPSPRSGFCSSFPSLPPLLVPNKLKATSASVCLRLCYSFSPSLSFGGVGVESGRWKEQQCSRRCLAMAASGPQDSAPSDMTRKVTIVNTAGEKLAGILDDTGSKELVVLCHGFRSSKDSNTLGGIAAAILKIGISTFRFDFAGNGESEGQFAYGNYWRETEDLRSVILYWRGQGREVTAILGHSKGGNVVVLYASKYGDVGTVINVSGRFDLAIGTEARFGKKGMELLHQQGFLDVKNKLSGEVEYRVTMKSLEDRLATDTDAAARSISNDVRVLTIHGDEDEIVATSDAHEFAKRIPNHVLKIIVGGNHNYEQSQKELSTLVLEFLQGKLSKI
ncbi:unnamed protein product [Calypogeia fissa]